MLEGQAAQSTLLDKQLAKLAIQSALTDAKLKESRDMLHGIGINLDHSAEELFYCQYREQ